MTREVFFETHSTSEDNELGLATGWLPGRLSCVGRAQAVELRGRIGDRGTRLVLCSDLARATETAAIATEGLGISVYADWRLRECNYGSLNGEPVEAVHHGGRREHLDLAYPGGESWRAAVDRVRGGLRALLSQHGATPVVVIGHVATRLAMDQWLGRKDLDDLIGQPFDWQPGWAYLLPGA